MLKISPGNIIIFNEQIDKYLKFLKSIIEDENIKKQIINYRNKITLGLLLDKNIVINIFYEYIYHHKEKIKNENDDIMILFQIHLFNNKLDLNTVWKTTKDEDKKTIWKYLKILILLCEQD